MLKVPDSPVTRFAQETERRRIARQLHDGVVQSLSALVTDLEYFRTRRVPTLDQTSCEIVEKVAQWQELACESLTLIREALNGIRNPVELDLGLDYAIQTMLTELRKNGYCVVFDCKEWPTLLPAEYTSIIYYMVREALMNVQKHSQASTVNVSLGYFEERLHVCIDDDGVGMEETDFTSTTRSDYHQGFIGMREWATLLNGCLTIKSTPGRGTRVDLEIPYGFGRQSAKEGRGSYVLTARESEILVLIARGMLAKEIARTLAISEKTVRNHFSNIYRKLNIFDRSQLVIYAMRNGLIDIYEES